MKKPKGPELKMPALKTPAFLTDLYYDLRDRRLLPLVALVVVAIAAVPFLLGGGGEEAYVPASGAPLSTLGSSAEKTSKLTVVEATPGLRDYRKRLSDRTPANPFKQRYTALPESAQVQSSGGSEGSGSGSSAVTVTESDTTEVSGSAASGGSKSGGNGSGGGSGSGKSGPPRLFQFVVDVQISHEEETADGGRKMSEPEVRSHVRPLTQLPGKEKPVVTTMGVNLHNGKVFFLVSNEVNSLDGDFACIARTPTGTCELLEIQPGMQLEAAYGPEKVLYRLKVTKIDVVADGRAGDKRSPRAAFVALPPGALPTP